MKLDLEKMMNELAENYVLLLRLHPAVKSTINYSEQYPEFVYDYSSSNYDINELLLFGDYLITDYSSLPYEFSLLNKPMIFFAYDLETYSKERGLLDHYEQMVPGPIVKQTDDVIYLLKEKQFDFKQIKDYAEEWNKYSKGHSSKSIVQYMFKKDSIRMK